MIGIDGRVKSEILTPTEPMVIHLPRIPLDGVVLGTPLDDVEFLARHDHVGGVGAAGPFLAVGAVAEGGGLGGAGVLVRDGGAEAGSFDHFG